MKHVDRDLVQHLDPDTGMFNDVDSLFMKHLQSQDIYVFHQLAANVESLYEEPVGRKRGKGRSVRKEGQVKLVKKSANGIPHSEINGLELYPLTDYQQTLENHVQQVQQESTRVIPPK